MECGTKEHPWQNDSNGNLINIWLRAKTAIGWMLVHNRDIANMALKGKLLEEVEMVDGKWVVVSR